MDAADVAGLVASLARPGGNITGLSFETGAVSVKLLELLKEAHPRISRVAVLSDKPELLTNLKRCRTLPLQRASSLMCGSANCKRFHERISKYAKSSIRRRKRSDFIDISGSLVKPQLSESKT
jgi:hypothetical protein